MSPKTGKTAERQAGILFRLEAMTLELGLQAVRYAAWWYDNVRLYPACVSGFQVLIPTLAMDCEPNRFRLFLRCRHWL